MLIQRGQDISGLDAVDARELMRELGRVAMSAGAIAQTLDVSREVAESVVSRLESSGFIERCTERPDRYRHLPEEGREGSRLAYCELWTTAVAGNALAKARIDRGQVGEVGQALGLHLHLVELHGRSFGQSSVR